MRPTLRPISSFASFALGLGITLILALCSMGLARLGVFASAHISPLIIAIVLGMLVAGILGVIATRHAGLSPARYKSGIDFSAKRLLRFGIILYGFFVSLADMQSVGVVGVALAVAIVVGVLGIGFVVGRKVFRLDRELAMLMSAGCAICGAAAVLALESALKANPSKSALAIGSVVVFGLVGMFACPILFSSALLPFTQTQMGLYTGATLYEVANVVGASNILSQEAANIALIEKMLRVAMLAPVLFVVPFLFDRSARSSGGKNGGKKLYIPWFALGFVAVVLLHSYIALPEPIIDGARWLCVLCLSMAMCALGLQISPKQFASAGSSGVLWFGVFLFALVSVGGFGLVFLLARFGLFA